jgi:pyrroline-5-carboxylate reductase
MIGFIGAGNMAEALIKGMLQTKKFKTSEILASEPKEDRRSYLQKTYNINTLSSNKEIVSLSDIIILAVKPQMMDQVLEEIKNSITENKTVVSIAAGITLLYLSSKLKTKKLIRVMPNTPALVGEGMSVISAKEKIPAEDIASVKNIFASVGKVIEVSEEQMDTVTALSGSGPGFIALFAEAIIENSIKLGLSSKDANELATQTLLGTAKLLSSGISPAKLREMVTSPGGTTEAGLKIFEKREFSKIVGKALEAAYKRSKELGEKR